jgi:hypothetical protein
MRPVLDIWHRSIARVPLLDQTTVGDRITGGVLAHVAEQIVGRDPLTARSSADERAPTVGSIFEAARTDGIPFRVISTVDELAAWSISPDAAARLAEALERGWVAVAPERSMPFGGQERIGWWLIDPATGRAADQLDTGGGSVDTETAVLWYQAVEAQYLRELRCMQARTALIAFVTAATLSEVTAGILKAALSTGNLAAAAGAVAALGGSSAGAIGIDIALSMC